MLLPALVLHGWEFTRKPVSNIAADYLASTFEQPLLCIGAINPGEARLESVTNVSVRLITWPPPSSSRCSASAPSTLVRPAMKA